MTSKPTPQQSEHNAWRIRAGLHGEDAEAALANHCIIIGFPEVPDMSEATTRHDVEGLVRPTTRRESVTHTTTQLYGFALRMSTDDVVLLPRKLERPDFAAIGEVTGPYEYRSINSEMRHTRPVKWTHDDVPHDALPVELHPYLDLRGTVTRVARDDARHRLTEIALSRDPLPSETSSHQVSNVGDEAEPEVVAQDLPLVATAEIRNHIHDRFRSHRFAELVDAILRANGYITHLSPPGPDGGVDIIAGLGALGFNEPRLCVQVKATQAAADVKVVRELRGAMETFEADRGLFVSWGGFTGPARMEARSRFFRMRLWTADDVINALCDVYDKLDKGIQAEIPLKQIWTLVPEESDA